MESIQHCTESHMCDIGNISFITELDQQVQKYFVFLIRAKIKSTHTRVMS